MSTLQQTSSAGSSETETRYAMMDEKKRKRMISNRESARRSRLKRQKRIQDVINEISALQRKTQEGKKTCNLMMQKINVIESENNILKAEKTRLADHMKRLETTMMNLKQNDDQTTEILGDCRKPWQVGGCVGGDGGSIQQIKSSGMFKI